MTIQSFSTASSRGHPSYGESVPWTIFGQYFPIKSLGLKPKLFTTALFA